MRRLLHRDSLAEGGPLSIATLKSEPTPRTGVGLEHAIECARVALDNKAQNILVLDLRAITPLYDFLVLGTGASRRQIHNLAEEIDADDLHCRCYLYTQPPSSETPARRNEPIGGWSVEVGHLAANSTKSTQDQWRQSVVS